MFQQCDGASDAWTTRRSSEPPRIDAELRRGSRDRGRLVASWEIAPRGRSSRARHGAGWSGIACATGTGGVAADPAGRDGDEFRKSRTRTAAGKRRGSRARRRDQGTQRSGNRRSGVLLFRMRQRIPGVAIELLLLHAPPKWSVRTIQSARHAKPRRRRRRLREAGQLLGPCIPDDAHGAIGHPMWQRPGSDRIRVARRFGAIANVPPPTGATARILATPVACKRPRSQLLNLLEQLFAAGHSRAPSALRPACAAIRLQHDQSAPVAAGAKRSGSNGLRAAARDAYDRGETRVGCRIAPRVRRVMRA